MVLKQNPAGCAVTATKYVELLANKQDTEAVAVASICAAVSTSKHQALSQGIHLM
jgi:sugar/nucleoside kinase (ribokinase family)